jgi:hypothetical protein
VTTYDLSALPPNHKLYLRHLGVQQNRRLFGPSGDETDSWDAENPKLWHATITRVVICDPCGSDHESMWFKGHGYSAEEALEAAWRSLQHFMRICPQLYSANDKPNEDAPPAGGKA